MPICKYTRDRRLKIYKQRKKDGHMSFPCQLNWTFTKWNEFFKKLPEETQDEMNTEYCTKEREMQYTFEQEFNSNGHAIGSASVVHKRSGIKIPFIWLDGGGDQFDDWHKIPVVEQSRMVADWRAKEGERRKPKTSLFDCCDAPCTAVPCVPSPWGYTPVIQEQEKEQTMRIETIAVAPAAQSEIATQRHFLENELYAARSLKARDMRKDFFLEDDEAPKTIKERKQRIADGKYIIDWNVDEDDYDEDMEYYGVSRGSIIWRDPKFPKDQKGYDAAIKAMETEVKLTKRIIEIKDADAGLTAVTDFEAKTFH